MDTHKKIREHISALSDGELPAQDLELAFAALQTADGRQAWQAYHRIGDVLRAQATPEMSDAFAQKLAERLAGEPAPLKRALRTAEEKRVESPGQRQGKVGNEQKSHESVAAVAASKPAIISMS